MKKPTTVRLPEELLRKVQKYARRNGMERGEYLRKLIKRGLTQEMLDAAIADYEAGRLSAGQVCETLGLSPWELVDMMKARGIDRNVTFEDWMDSREL
jgi:predicted DNA-binding protein